NPQHTVEKQSGRSNLKPFVKGDPRINRTDRGKTFDELRRTADMIANELVPGADGKMITRGELLLRSWIKSKNPILQRSFIEYWVGKPVDRIAVEELKPTYRLVLKHGHEHPDYKRPDSERPALRLSAGARAGAPASAISR